MSETDFKECLALSWGVALACIRPTVEIGIYDAKVAGAILETSVGAADLHTVEDVEEFYPQLSLGPFAKEEFLCQADVLVGIKRIAQGPDLARRVALSKPGVGKGCCIENRQAFIIVVVVHTQWNARIEISAIEPIQKWIIVIRENLNRSE